MNRLEGVVLNGPQTLHAYKQVKCPKPAFTDEDVIFFRKWELEAGFSCLHRRPRQYLVESGVKWTILWERYAKKADGIRHRVIQYCRWTQHVHMHFLGVRVSRTKDHLCYACVRIETALKDPKLDPAEKEALECEKQMHLDASINQRRAMSEFVQQYVAAHPPQKIMATEIIPEPAGVPILTEPLQHPGIPLIQIQIEDFGGSFPLHVYVTSARLLTTSTLT